jgi:hypothetical protein
MLHRGSVSGR